MKNTLKSGLTNRNGRRLLYLLPIFALFTITCLSVWLPAASGSGLRNAIVTITDQNGNARSTRTGSFGYYQLEDIEAGHAYLISVSSKSYRFTPRILQVVDNLTDVDFTAEP